MVDRGFVPTHGLGLYEKLDPLAPTATRIVDHYGDEILSDQLWDQVAGTDVEKQIIDGRVVAPLADPETARRIGVRAPATVMLFGPASTPQSSAPRRRSLRTSEDDSVTKSIASLACDRASGRSFPVGCVRRGQRPLGARHGGK